jgi:hypothetical protein
VKLFRASAAKKGERSIRYIRKGKRKIVWKKFFKKKIE